MAQTKRAALTRKTRADIAKIPADQVRAELIAAGLRPIEFVTVNDEIFYAYPRVRLEQHQRWDWAEYAPHAYDPWVTDYYKRWPPDDLPTMWRNQLYDHELETYMASLS